MLRRVTLWLLRLAGRLGDRRQVEGAAEEFIARDGASWTVRLEYPPAELAPRYGHGRPEHARLSEILARGEERYRQNLRGLLAFEDDLRRIPSRPAGPGVPYWLNQWLPDLDGIALYGFTRSRAPRTYLEVGSGLSTMFVRQAIRDGGLETKITSVDPAPRAEVDELCDRLIRSPLEATELSALGELEAGDVVFFDGSHRVLMNSDVTVFFLEVLPQLPAGVLVGVHDVLWPEDYLPMWADFLWSEQYLVAAWLLGGGAGMEIELPAHYVTQREAYGLPAAPLWGRDELAELGVWGTTFWFSTTGG